MVWFWPLTGVNVPTSTRGESFKASGENFSIEKRGYCRCTRSVTWAWIPSVAREL